MIILGLTGSIAMGKSTAAGMFRRLGVSVHDADRAVHHLMAKGGDAVAAIEAAFPGVVVDGAVDRARLANRVFGHPDRLALLERLLHPLVGRRQRRFLASAARAGRSLVVLDIPLLFETGGERWCDAVAVVSAPLCVQRQRLRQRGLADGPARAILARQMADSQKRRRADFVIPTGLGRAVSERAIRAIVADLGQRRGCRWHPRCIGLDLGHGTP